MAFADSQDNAVIIPVSKDGVTTITLSGTVTAGDAIGYSGGWQRALATTGSVIQMRCAALEDGVAGQSIAVSFGVSYLEGSRLSGGTEDSALYVAEGTAAGQYTETAPTTSGDANTIVGWMLSGTRAILTPNYNADSTA